jgi:hypothetical protein
MRSTLARLTRFERATPAFGGLYSIQLSYRRAAPKLTGWIYFLPVPEL